MLVVASCTSEAPNTTLEPEKAILGKWEVISIGGDPPNSGIGFTVPQDLQHSGIFPGMRDTGNGYVEYLPDSLIMWHNKIPEYNVILIEKYWIDDSFFHLKFNYKIDLEGTPLVYRYVYRFYDDKMWLENIDLNTLVPRDVLLQPKK